MNLRKLFFDIETVPADASKHPALAAMYESRKQKGKTVPDDVETFISNTGLSGEFGRIISIGYAVNDDPVEALWGGEREILEQFWAVAKGVDRFIGHNIYDFDFPFIMKRSRILGVKPTLTLSFARYRQTPIYDTMREWDLWAHRQCSLDMLAQAMGLPTSKDKMDGSEVAAYFAAGKIEDICVYCKKDVELTRQVYRKMTFDGTYG